MGCHKTTLLTKFLSKNALHGRFFISFSFFLYLFTGQTFALTPECVSTNFDEQAQINYVIDGDTVILTDKRHIRLIGINTPEIHHDGSPPEPGAIKARAQLIELLGSNKHISLKYDKERKDRHGRTLAHLFLPNGKNIQAGLLEMGLAMPLNIPPNLLFLDCYSKVSNLARKDKIGLWALAHYRPRNTDELSGSDTGFRYIQGMVLRISESRSSIWFNLENNVALRIVREDLQYFDKSYLTKLINKEIEANGWLYQRNGQLRMRIRHPHSIRIISDNSRN